MGFFQTIKLAIKNIRSNKLRSALTMIGIIIGISSVIVLVGMGSGSTKQITSQVQSLGTNLISANTSNNNGSKQFTLNDVKNIEVIQGVDKVAPIISTSTTVKVDKNSQNASVTGTTSNFLDIRNMTISEGRFIADLDVDYRGKVAVLGSNIATELYGFTDPVGKSIDIKGNTYEVVGVLKSQGSSMGSNTDDMVIVPSTTAVGLAGTRNVQNIYIKASDQNNIDALTNEINGYINNFFKSTDTNNRVMSQKQLLDTMSSITSTMTYLLGGIAAISLVVGGIGVMNVMLVSVSERTKEIGIRKALGGSRKDILIQFLIEALVLSSLGGVAGVLFGLALGWGVTAVGMSMSFSLPVVMVAFSFSLAVGIVFGIFPAYKASKLKPIDALRFE
ncbi:FtsX-like permease family protein [Clostridium sp. P21]|uniref:FtsX-like permease family protein n=1 Tax=Clostridium muellerianum TaxID=2716538 RepID=A0A7Y0EF69_9CLOT|nr:ABC transporter permease [Clostridium muellerianum]NMM62396.1 FtsX-like permease family protein [Clostridium muellerianum]